MAAFVQVTRVEHRSGLRHGTPIETLTINFDYVERFYLDRQKRLVRVVLPGNSGGSFWVRESVEELQDRLGVPV